MLAEQPVAAVLPSHLTGRSSSKHKVRNMRAVARVRPVACYIAPVVVTSVAILAFFAAAADAVAKFSKTTLVADARSRKSTFIATVSSEADIGALHKALTASALVPDPTSPLRDADNTVHELVRSMVVSCGKGTCSELLKHDGIQTCEANTVL
jgi:hypothetical protein